MNRRVIDTSEILGIVQTEDGPRELCVSGDAQYDRATSSLFVQLDAFLGNTDLVAREQHFSADWLPKPETIREGVEMSEAGDMARDIFHSWVRKVRHACSGLTSASPIGG